jgi:hypothetical protein
MRALPATQNTKMLHRLLLLCCLTVPPPVVRAEEWQMIFKVTTLTSTGDAPGGAREKGAPPTHWVVRLGQGHLCLADKASLTIHDFQGRRTLRFVGGLRTGDHSLYAVAARREADFLRELNGIAMLQKAGLAREDLGTLYYEAGEPHRPSLTGLPHDTLPVRSRDQTGNYTYLLNNRFMASFQLSEVVTSGKPARDVLQNSCCTPFPCIRGSPTKCAATIASRPASRFALSKRAKPLSPRWS